MILVTGATGTVGGAVGRLLAGRAPLRVLAREPRRVAFAGPGVEVCPGEYADTGALERALRGVEAAFLVTTGLDEPHDADFLRVAREAGVFRVVKLSAAAVTDPEAGDVITRRQRENEELVRTSGLDWVLLRPRQFMTNTLAWAGSIRSEGLVHGLGGSAPNSCVDPRDVAEVAVRALTDPEPGGRVHTITGPKAVTPVQQTAALARALGRPLEYRELTPCQARERLGLRYPEPVVEALLQSAARQQAGAKKMVTGTVLEVTGRPPRSFQAWAAEHVLAFA